MRTAIAVALLAVVALFVWLLTAGGGTPVQSHVQNEAVKTSAAAETAQAPTPTTPEQPASTPQREVAKEPVTGPVATVRVVTFGTKAPVAGASVHYQSPSFNWQALSRSRQEELSKLANTDNESFLQQIGVEVVTDADGQCVVPLDQHGTSLCARAGELFGQSFARTDAKEIQQVVVRPDRTLRLLVLDPNNAPAPGITVQVEREPGAPADVAAHEATRWQLGPSDSSGRLEQRHAQSSAGEYATCSVRLAAMPPGGLGPAVVVDLTAPPREVVLRMPGTGSLTVHVRDFNGRPIDPALLGEPEVHLAALDHQPVNSQEQSDAFNRQRNSAPIDANGDAEFPCVVLARYLLVELGWSFNCKGLEGPTTANQHVEATLQESATDAIFVGVLLRPDGTPFANSKYSISCRYERGFSSQSPRTDGQGRMRSNLSGYVTGMTVVITVGTDAAVRDNPMAVQLPPRPVTAGINDLGELRLAAQRVLVAGKLVADAGVEVKRVQLEIERRAGEHWSQEYNLQPDWQADGSFSVRSGIPAGEPLRLVVREGPYLPVEPIECKSGDSSIEIRLHAAGSAIATFLVDERTPTDRMVFRFRRTRPPEQLDSRGRMLEQYSGMIQSPSNGRARKQWTGLSPGAYHLTVLCQGVEAPIVSIDAIEVAAGLCADPRLTDIDLRGRVRTIEIRATGADATPVADAKAFVIIRSQGEQWYGYHLGNGVARLAAPAAVDLFVLAPGYAMATVEGVTESRTIPLQPAGESRLAVQLPAPLPEGVETQLRLQPQLNLPKRASIAFDTGRGMGLENCFVEEVLVGADGVAKVPVRWPGEYTVVATVGTSGRGASYIYDVDPRKITLPTAQDAIVRVGQKDFAAAIERLRK